LKKKKFDEMVMSDENDWIIEMMMVDGER